MVNMKKHLTLTNILFVIGITLLIINSYLRYENNKSYERANIIGKQIIEQDSIFINKALDLDTSMQNYFNRIDSTNRERKEFLDHLKICKHK